MDWPAQPTNGSPNRHPVPRLHFVSGCFAFFLTSRGSIDDSIRLLEEYRAQQKERYVEFKSSEAMLAQAVRTDVMPDTFEPLLGTTTERSDELLIFFLTLRHGILAIEARMAWVAEALRALRARKRHRHRTR